jgi:hypothetical protein
METLPDAAGGPAGDVMDRRCRAAAAAAAGFCTRAPLTAPAPPWRREPAGAVAPAGSLPWPRSHRPCPVKASAIAISRASRSMRMATPGCMSLARAPRPARWCCRAASVARSTSTWCSGAARDAAEGEPGHAIARESRWRGRRQRDASVGADEALFRDGRRRVSRAAAQRWQLLPAPCQSAEKMGLPLSSDLTHRAAGSACVP